ncbi:unnamed protein product [Prorocentrum cordatum]|uniref:Glycosyltransferase 2-like domain-containing protein n=1 Tax=Prorocentrum cordatum TaxID=2364126 RepID=A0ABN9QDB3_9DINO|nr:unnamed protein product [Polarella glacialis]|mmetsp:Transcript_3129/g.8460  ORF Transcript_3129/g.8460 Transcript_3129/m.8460 type:complete len:119 (+) Transcript_3129:266-622(+)
MGSQAQDEGNPLVSIMVLTFNQPAFVTLALRQISAQDYPNIEVVLVDDGTPSIEVVLRPDLNIGASGLSFMSAPVTLVRSATRLSIGAKRNMGLTAARGSIVVHWDDDDLYPPNRVSV